MLAASSLLLTLVFGLMTPVFSAFTNKKMWSGFFFLTGLGFILIAHFYSNYDFSRKKPNSLLYVLDADANRGRWLTYDSNLDDWTKKYVGGNLKRDPRDIANDIFSKYNTSISYSRSAPTKAIPKPTIAFERDSVVGKFRYLKIKISPNRRVNRYDILASQNLKIFHLKANGVKSLAQKGDLYPRTTKRVLSYYAVDNEPLILDFCIPKQADLDMDLLESSFDLLNNPYIKVAPRQNWMMPKPFVLTDAVVIQQKIKPSFPTAVKKYIPYPTTVILKDSITNEPDTVIVQ